MFLDKYMTVGHLLDIYAKLDPRSHHLEPYISLYILINFCVIVYSE